MAGAFKQYYEDELAFLRELGGEFAHAYPDIARELGLGGHDPDVERLLQGVAFLTGRIRQGLDAEFPALLYPLLGHLFPQALRPAPCAVILEFEPRPNMFREPELLKAGAQVRSVPVDGTACPFQTAYATPILPLKLESVRLSEPAANQHRLTIALHTLPGAALSRLGELPLRLYFHGATLKGLGREAYGTYAWLGQSLRGITLRTLAAAGASDESKVLGECKLPCTALRPVGWELAESLLPYPPHSPTGYRHLIEYFLFPAKYLFYDLHGLSALARLPTAERFEVVFDLLPRLGEPLNLTTDHVHINCVPAVNLFPHTAAPLQVDGTRSEHLLRPEGRAPDHYDIFAVERVVGHVQRNPRPIEYQPFFSFQRPATKVGDQPVMYQVLLRPPVSTQRSAREGASAYPAVPTYLSFVAVDGGATELAAVVSVDLLCTNRDLPLRLRPGEICRPTSDIPSTLRFADLGAISEPAPAPIGGDGLWRFFAYLMMGMDAIRDPAALHVLLQLYNFPARYNQAAFKKLDVLRKAIVKVSAEPDRRVVGRPPAVLCGTRVTVDLHEKTAFAHLGELWLFASALERFLADSATINSYIELCVRGIDQGMELGFAPRLGLQGLL